jgi:hypothetical protein
MTLVKVNRSLMVGSMEEAHGYWPHNICVVEKPWCCRSTGCLHYHPLPDLENAEQLPVDAVAGDGHHMNLSVLKVIGQLYDDYVRRGAPMVIHCRQGRERGPLVTAYLLVTRHDYTFDTAYSFLRRQNPAIIDRRSWLP